MGVTNFTNNPPDGNGGNPPIPPGGIGVIIGGMPSGSPAKNARKQGEVPEILVNLNTRAKNPCLYRDAVISQVSSILIGRHKPNALLIGPAGTGKTAIAEELARRIEAKDPTLPPQLAGKTIYSLQCSDLVAGNGIVGMLEDAVKDVIGFLAEPKNNAIVFIDEIHQLMSGKGTYQTIAQILKPALSRGNIKVIAATTTQEAKDLDNDPAFNRRFTRVLVDELSKEQAAQILLASHADLTNHYKTVFPLSPETAMFIVNTADEFCTAGNHRPDNAITLLDRCVSSSLIEKQAMLASPDPNVSAAAKAIPGIILSENSIRRTALKLATGNNAPADFDPEKFKQDFSRIKGQDAVLDPLLRIMKRHTAHLRPASRPLTMLFMGGSGTGKTEVTKILAENYLSEKPIILNMTEYTDNASINRIIGSPAGFVGYDDNNEMPFDALDTNPYQVILLDEFEKCHRSVQTLFMRVFDEGVLKTARGKTIDFSKAIIIATTNAGCTNDMETPIGFLSREEKEPDDASIIRTLSGYFNIELLNRFTKRFRFGFISKETFKEIVKETYESDVQTIKNLHPSAKIPDAISDDDADAITEKYYEKKFGARPVKEAVSEFIDGVLIP